MNKITIIVGAAYGSEAKGTIAGYLAVKDNYDIAVRTGAINAGHSVYYKD
ncbi:MAG: Adenylosuccinate synthetase, partial [Candidatus Giovannonibacteria bacterium GW2011_GWB1_47_6b]